MTTYTARESGPHWIVSQGDREIAKYRKDEIAYNGYVDIDELKREIRASLDLQRSDRLIVED